MKITSLTAAVLGGTLIAAAVPAVPAFAHHSHAMFDDSQQIEITGTVLSFRFANPHVYLFMAVQNANGETQNWAVEMSHIGNMLNRGVTADTFKEGDMVQLVVAPLRSGDPGGSYDRIISINGVTNAGEGANWAPAA